eukprot:TRINITY_DN5585_c0_g1_i1.p1 TRINITY_DN5585_c0_g1~~TRINITY_DN5585_c0_g1_i1.p1  ORF type:complete len:828 (+),score=136.49 TRINITY_DN5585_c0_g1_i1:86-2569(+)
MFQDDDPWADFNLSQSIGIPRFEDSQPENLFNLGLSVSQEIPIGASLDYDESGEAHFLPRSNSMSLFPGLPFFERSLSNQFDLTATTTTTATSTTTTQSDQPVIERQTSLLCTSSELSADGQESTEEPNLKRKNGYGEEDAQQKKRKTDEAPPPQYFSSYPNPAPSIPLVPSVPVSSISSNPAGLSVVPTIPRPMILSSPPPTVRITRSLARMHPNSPATPPPTVLTTTSPSASVPNTPFSGDEAAYNYMQVNEPLPTDGRLVAISKRQAHLMGFYEGLPESSVAHLQRAEQMLKQVKQLYEGQEQAIEEIKKKQNNELKIRFAIFSQGTIDEAMLGSSQERCQQLIEEQERLLKQQSLELQRLSEIIKTIVLDSFTLHAVRTLVISIQLQAQQLAILREELVEDMKWALSRGEGYPGIVDPLGLSTWRLVIIEQPLPHVMFKCKQIEVSFTIGIVTGARGLELPHNFSRDVQCILDVPEGIQEEQANVQPLDNFVALLDIHQRQAIFNQLKVNISTRMTMVSLKFGMKKPTQNKAESAASKPRAKARGRCTPRGGRGKGNNYDEEEHTPENETRGQLEDTENGLVSPMSYPFIVITHENQWVEAASKLLLVDCFSGCTEVPWAQFANTMHTHFLSSIKQDLASPTRPLQLYELKHFHQKLLGGRDVVTLHNAQTFFAWFGHVQRTIRFKKHISNLWNEGLVFGFMAKEVCEQILAPMEPGVFIIRFSDSRPGLFAVAYVSTSLLPKHESAYEVKHYLVNTQDTGSNKSLPDFLRSLGILSHILKIDPVTGGTTKIAKDVALNKYYTKQKGNGTPLKGYVNNIHSGV